MPTRDIILNLPGFTIKKVSGYDPILLEVHYRRKAQCPFCQSKKVRKKDSFVRLIKHELIGLQRTFLRVKAYKFYCTLCHRYFNQRFPGIGKHQRATERLREQVFIQHTQGISQKDLAFNFKIGKATVERWFHHGYQLKYQEKQRPFCPRVLGIDEHFFTRKQRFVTTLCDLRKHKVFDIAKGYCTKTLADYFKSLPGKERVQVVCIDLSSRYKEVVKNYFPNAQIVADRFHVIRLLQHHCMQTYQAIDPKIKKQRGLLNALRTNPENLKEKRLQRRDHYLNQQPAIAAIYQFKQQLHRLLMKKTMKRKRCRRYIPVFLKMINQLKHSGFKQLKTLGKTLYHWREEIVRMWRFTKNNGITEGFHRKMKLIQRRAYGFKNFENYRLRVKVLCS